jgi:hypothetical protein
MKPFNFNQFIFRGIAFLFTLVPMMGCGQYENKILQYKTKVHYFLVLLVLIFSNNSNLWAGAGPEWQQPSSLTVTSTASVCQNGATSLSATTTYSAAVCYDNGNTLTPIPVTYQWYSDANTTPGGGTAIGGATSATYSPPTTTVGIYYYYCVINWTSPGGTCSNGPLTSSNNSTVTVVAPPSTSNAGTAQNLAACATSATLAGNTPASGTGTWTYTTSPAGGPAPTYSPNANTGNATVSGLGIGYTYTFTWTIANSPCTSSASSMTVTTVAGPGCNTYCTPSMSPGSTTYGQITNVTFDDINNTTAGANVGYQNFFPGQVATVNLSNSYTLSVSGTAIYNGTGSNPLRTACVMAYFDFNGDGDMTDPGEAFQVGQYAAAAGTQTVSTNITIPATAYTNANLQFRVILVEGPCPVTANPCPTLSTQGQVESYAFFVSNCTMTVPNGGSDVTLGNCVTSTSLAGNAIANGTGTWQLVSGSGTITSPNSPTSTVTNLGPGANEFMWLATPTDPNCPTLSDNVIITTSGLPTTANAGSDIETCNTSIALAGNTPTVGTGLWTIVAGPGSISAPASNPTATVSGLVLGLPTTLQWTITSASGCVSSDQVVVTMITGVTAANAGPDQTGLCTGSAINLSGNNPANGVGTWTGSGGIIANPSSPTSTINALNTAGTYTYTWTVSAPGCASSIDAVNITVAFCDPNMNTVTCGTPVTFTDGAGTQYANNSLIVEKFCPSTPGQYVTATFTEVAFYNLLDHMIVLNGSSYSAPIIDDFYSLPTINGGANTITSSAADGCLTFIFLSSPTNVGNGWTASINCTAAPSTTNTANCDWTNCLGGCLRTICGVPTSVPFTGAGVGSEELNNVNGGCLGGGERCSNWFLINPTSAGTLTMNMFVNSGQDQDFAVWEAYDPLLECPSMTGDAPIMCNFAGATAEGTGFNSTIQTLPNAAYEPSLNISAAQISAGVYYIVLVNTYNNGGACPQPTVDITFGGSASLSCNPPIVLGDDDIILNGLNDGMRNYLTWQVENELNVDHYSLERSKNGTDWTIVGVRGSHKSASGSEYYMYDEMPYDPFTYYRVKQINSNGEEKTSDIITISSGKLGEFWVSELFPNPTSEEVSFQYQANNFEEPVDVVIYNSIGQIVISEEFEVSNLTGITIPTDKLAIGTYQVKISQGDREAMKRLSIIR